MGADETSTSSHVPHDDLGPPLRGLGHERRLPVRDMADEDQGDVETAVVRPRLHGHRDLVQAEQSAVIGGGQRNHRFADPDGIEQEPDAGNLRPQDVRAAGPRRVAEGFVGLVLEVARHVGDLAAPGVLAVQRQGDAFRKRVRRDSAQRPRQTIRLRREQHERLGPPRCSGH